MQYKYNTMLDILLISSTNLYFYNFRGSVFWIPNPDMLILLNNYIEMG